ncbi:MAG: hypothetical protein AB7P40_26555 [Chloroflexota bacterium]
MHRLGTRSRLPGMASGVRLGAAGVTTRLALMAGAVVLAFALAVGTSAAPARANGTPIRIVLSYLSGVSNFGPQNATGVAEMITSEGEVRLTATGLQKLADNEEYHVWISAGSERMDLVAFQVNDAGIGRVDTVVKSGIPEKAWDLMVITAEEKGTPAAPSERRAIAGRFSMTGNAVPVPKVLPNTGGDLPGGATAPTGLLGMSNGGLVLLGLLVVGVIGFALGRVGARRGT